MLGNKLLTLLSNMFTNLNLTDMENCYKVFRANLIKDIKLEENRFGFELAVTAKISKIKILRIYKVGVNIMEENTLKIKRLDGKMVLMLLNVL